MHRDAQSAILLGVVTWPIEAGNLGGETTAVNAGDQIVKRPLGAAPIEFRYEEEDSDHSDYYIGNHFHVKFTGPVRSWLL